MVAASLTVSALALFVLCATARRAREAAQVAITTIAATRRDLRPALVLARDDAQRAAAMRLPQQR